MLWEATALVDKTPYAQQSRSNPVSGLFRLLVEAA